MFIHFIWYGHIYIFCLNTISRCRAGHTSPILCASFSPTGTLLATGSGDTNARLWDLNTETPSHVLSGHKGWVLCVEWEAMERKLATGGHDGHVSLISYYAIISTDWILGQIMGSKNRESDRRSSQRALKVDYFPIMGADTHVRLLIEFFIPDLRVPFRNPSSPRLASSSKDGTVKVWSTLTRRAEYTLGGHTASVNIVRWGGSGGPKGVLYTASSDRTVRVWDAEQGRPLHTLKEHAHWVTTLTLNTDFVLRTGPFDHTGKRPSSDEEGTHTFATF